MKLKINLDDFRADSGKTFRISKTKTKVKSVYDNSAHYEALIAQFRVEIDDLQQKMYAQDRQGLRHRAGHRRAVRSILLLKIMFLDLSFLRQDSSNSFLECMIQD